MLYFINSKCYMITCTNNPTEEEFYTKILPSAVNQKTSHSNIHLIQELDDFSIDEGDVVGVGVDFENERILVTYNGFLMGSASVNLEEKEAGILTERLYVPMIRNVSRFVINIGQSPFQWPYAKERIDKLLEYFVRP